MFKRASSSPVLVSVKSHSISPHHSDKDAAILSATELLSSTNTTTLTSDESGCGLDSTLTSCNTQSDYYEEYDLEVRTLHQECINTPLVTSRVY